MNKADLVKALESRLDTDRKTVAGAVDGMVDIIIRSVTSGEKVSITGFGVFEKRRRNARTARNPATGATVKVKATNVPAFRPGAGFKEVVSGAKKLPKATTPAKRVAATKATTSGRSAAKRTATAKKAASARPAAKKTTATKSTATKTTAKRATKTTAAKTTAARTTAKKAPAKKTATKRTR